MTSALSSGNASLKTPKVCKTKPVPPQQPTPKIMTTTFHAQFWPGPPDGIKINTTMTLTPSPAPGWYQASKTWQTDHLWKLTLTLFRDPTTLQWTRQAWLFRDGWEHAISHWHPEDATLTNPIILKEAWAQDETPNMHAQMMSVETA